VILGLLFLVDKKTLKRLEDTMNKPIGKSATVSESSSRLLGAALIIFAGVMFYLAFSLGR
jgi:hypothetical protein